jgi:hypothetical protein
MSVERNGAVGLATSCERRPEQLKSTREAPGSHLNRLVAPGGFWRSCWKPDRFLEPLQAYCSAATPQPDSPHWCHHPALPHCLYKSLKRSGEWLCCQPWAACRDVLHRTALRMLASSCPGCHCSYPHEVESPLLLLLAQRHPLTENLKKKNRRKITNIGLPVLTLLA